MNIITSILVLSMLIPVISTGQTTDKVEISNNPPPPAISFPIVKQVGKVKVMYNARADRTIVQTSLLPVKEEKQEEIILQASFEIQGKQVSTPSQVTLSFYSTSKDRTYADNRLLKIYLDGSEILSDKAQYQQGNTDGYVYLISVSQNIPFEMFQKVIEAKSVKMQLGPTEFELKDSDLTVLRDMKKAIEQ